MIPSLHPLTNRLRRRMAAAVAVAVTAFLPLAVPTVPTAQASDAVRKADATGGYWMVASDGGIFSFGSAPFYGSTGDVKLNQPIVGMAASPTGKGYWFVAADGGIFSFGDAKFYGSTGAIKLNKPIVGMAPTPSGKGYWFVASDGGIFSFGDAKFYGSTGDVKLNKPIVGMAASPTGNGYWFVASDGGIFSFGDAKFYGSTGNVKLAKPITAMAASPSGKGYWFTASDGGVFSFGDAKFAGAEPSATRTVAAMVPAPDGGGYWMASSTGELLAFGNAANLGGLTKAPNKPIVGMTAVPAVASGPTGTNPTVPGDPTPTTTAPTTATTMPPYTGPMAFSNTALTSWGTPSDPNKPFVNSLGETKYPYAQKVLAMSEIGDRLYVGGEFTNLIDPQKNGATPALPWLAELDTNGIPAQGSAFNNNIHLDGPVMALLRSSDGSRLYVAGGFGHVNGDSSRARLFAVNMATKQVDPTFNPPTPNSYVNSMALLNNTLYVGGRFATLGSDTTHPQLAALNAGTGEIIPSFTPPPRYIGKYMTHTGVAVHDPQGTDPNVPDHNLTNPNTPDPAGIVAALTVTGDGKYLMVGGDFLHFGTPYDPNLSSSENNKHGGLIAVDPGTGRLCGQTGVACTWQPENSRPINGLTVWPGDGGKTVFAAAGGAGGRVIAFQSGGKTTALWRGNVDGDGMAVVATNDWVFLVGHFDWEVHNPAAKCLNTPTASGGYSCTPDPNAPPPPDQTPTPHRHIVAFDARGERQASNPSKFTGNSVVDPTFTAQADTAEGPYTAFIGANRLYIGGNFSKVSASPTANGRDAQVNQPGFAIYPQR